MCLVRSSVRKTGESLIRVLPVFYFAYTLVGSKLFVFLQKVIHNNKKVNINQIKKDYEKIIFDGCRLPDCNIGKCPV